MERKIEILVCVLRACAGCDKIEIEEEKSLDISIE